LSGGDSLTSENLRPQSAQIQSNELFTKANEYPAVYPHTAGAEKVLERVNAQLASSRTLFIKAVEFPKLSFLIFQTKPSVQSRKSNKQQEKTTLIAMLQDLMKMRVRHP